MNSVACFYTTMSAGLTITHQWKAPAVQMRGVIPGVHIGRIYNTTDFAVVDLETGGCYYIDVDAYRCAFNAQRLRYETMGKTMSKLLWGGTYLWPNITEDSINLEVRAGHWSTGLCLDWATRDGERVYFELSYDQWIVRGYVHEYRSAKI